MKQFVEAFSPNRAVSGTTMRLLAAVSAAFALVAWSLVPTKIIPHPLDVIDAFGSLWTRTTIGQDAITSVTLNIEAIALSTAISASLAYLSVLSGLRPSIEFASKLRFLGLTGLSFIFGLSFTGHALKLVLLTFGMSVFLLTSMVSVVASIPKEQFDYARTLRMSPWRATYEVVVLGTMDQMIEAVRQNAAIGWVMLTLVEGLVRSEGGIGMLLLNENKHIRLETVFALQILVLTIGLMQDYSIGVIRNLFCPWSDLDSSKGGK